MTFVFDSPVDFRKIAQFLKTLISYHEKTFFIMYKFKTPIIISAVLFIFLSMSSFHALQPDSIIGLWKEKDGTKTIKIYKVETSYFGKITENLSDDENKIQPGTVIMKDFVYENEEWKGTIEIPNRDLSLKGKITMENPDELKATATVVFIGKSKTWLRVK